jgi:hypothetical protein
MTSWRITVRRLEMEILLQGWRLCKFVICAQSGSSAECLGPVIRESRPQIRDASEMNIRARGKRRERRDFGVGGGTKSGTALILLARICSRSTATTAGRQPPRRLWLLLSPSVATSSSSASTTTLAAQLLRYYLHSSSHSLLAAVRYVFVTSTSVYTSLPELLHSTCTSPPLSLPSRPSFPRHTPFPSLLSPPVWSLASP